MNRDNNRLPITTRLNWVARATRIPILPTLNRLTRLRRLGRLGGMAFLDIMTILTRAIGKMVKPIGAQGGGKMLKQTAPKSTRVENR